MILLLVAVAAAHVLQAHGRVVAALFLVLMGLAGIPRTLLTLTNDFILARTSIASANFELRTGHLAIMLAILLVPFALKRPHLSVPLTLAPVLLALVAIGQGDLPTHVQVGVVQWVFVAIAWALGSALATEYGARRISERAMSYAIFAPLALNGFAGALQVLGVRGSGAVDLAGEALSRVSGYQAHSGILGKITVLLVVLALPLTRSRDVVARRVALATVALSFVLTGLTYSRANTAAIVTTLAIWFLIVRGSSLLGKVGIPIIVGFVSLPFVGVLLERQQLDAQGGSRPVLMEAALTQLRQSFWFGIGPNDYQSTVGQFSEISNVLPVHNSFLLVLIEAGVLVGALIGAPIVMTIFASVRARRIPGDAGLAATALLAALPGIIVIIYTGYSMASHHVAMLLFFVFGFTYRQIRGAAPVPGTGARERGRRVTRMPAGRYAPSVRPIGARGPARRPVPLAQRRVQNLPRA